MHRIEAADPYSDDYDETVARDVREQQAEARPAIARRLDSIDGYDTILLASPIWNVRAPMIMSTFAERYDFSGKTVHPITTYAMSAWEPRARTTQRSARAPTLVVGSPCAARRSAPTARPPSTRGCAAPTCLVAGYRAGNLSPVYPIFGACLCFGIRMVGVRYDIDAPIAPSERHRRRADD